ncbi:MAG TPA: glycoside hydrolase family 38 C-terminal domain-containing protein, partial [Verrucomicrobiae bacterium]|nr:glycoside hydrolase family 38 C-terminal domain-containing protein [Verrucomicrobiae bacterium]
MKNELASRHWKKLGATLLLALLAGPFGALAQKAWFADGYHGGVYGHYPPSFTQFIIDSLRQHPDWKLNLEIEPETFDWIRTNTPEAYAEFRSLAADQSSAGRLEFVNPAYGQSYLWNLSGESVIQQLDRGMSKLREHFTNVEFRTYCSEEPCFTSALPGILKSFGFHEAVLKNPNTCWGGYTRAFGGELVNWIGPDGSSIRTVPRYAIESLKPNSTWETIGAANATNYIESAFQAGIQHPIGMCLQDAGWRNGPWLKEGPQTFQPTEYTTWRHYFDTVAVPKPEQDWRVSQEDIQVSLVWGAQVLQRIAQQVRSAENRIVMAEKMATLAGEMKHSPWPQEPFNEAWRTLLLSQHHDCWIVPYNGPPHDTWADKVAHWTDSTRAIADQAIEQSLDALAPKNSAAPEFTILVFNTLAAERSALVTVPLSAALTNSPMRIVAPDGTEIPWQFTSDSTREIAFRATAPAMGFARYQLQRKKTAKQQTGATTATDATGMVRLETDLYRIELDPQHGGVIKSLVARGLGRQELLDPKSERRFNELRGYFPDLKQFCSTADHPARIEVLENGPSRVSVKITGQIASNSVTQWISLTQGEPRIDFRVRIDWQSQPRIGADPDSSSGFRREQDGKAFYDDRFKLLALFPVNFREQAIFKDAPFDVTASRLTNTFFEAWSQIKNDVILHWVDLYDASQRIGLTLMTDHTTSYAHGMDHPLALTLQYAGTGLWGRDYT